MLSSMPHPLNVTSWYFLLFSRFLRGEIHGLNTAFGLEEADLYEMRQCQGTVAFAIFGDCIFFSMPIIFTWCHVSMSVLIARCV